MQFQHPELLYALFLLIIPILVHLFQLRRFKEERFTNVAFLKKIQLQTRKSNTIKKWLILLTRMAALAMLVLAFAQPFSTQSDTATREKETIIYLDNSFSMQAKGPSGPLLRTAAQDLISSIPEEEKITLLTNTKVFKQTTIKNIRNELLQLPYTDIQLNEEAITLKARKEFSPDRDKDKRLIYISDFQGDDVDSKKDSLIEKHYVQLRPNVVNNVSIDSVFISGRKARSFELTVQLSTQAVQEVNTAVSLYNGDMLLAKGTASFDKELTTEVIFDIDNSDRIEGKVLIDDPLLAYDNTLYFSINKDRPIKVLSINGAASTYLSRIFTAPEFDYSATSLPNLDFSSITEYNYIVLNEIEEISSALVDGLSAFAKAGGTTTIILSPTGNLASYQKALVQLANLQVAINSKDTHLVTTINYSHPVYRDVFENQTKNFQYPSVSNSFNVLGGDALLRYDDGAPFLTERNNFYVITGGITAGNSNFTSSPLVVPTFYNMSRQSLRLPKLYINTGMTNTYDIPASLENDAILNLESTTSLENNLIPLQQSQGTKVRITTSQEPTLAGAYNVKLKDSLLQQVSYNYPRTESVLRYRDMEKTGTGSFQTSVGALYSQLQQADTVQSLWKWFVIFALTFLLLEILILKFYK